MVNYFIALAEHPNQRITRTVTATSPEIDRIDKAMVEEIKYDIFRRLRLKELGDGNQMMTMEEYLKIIAKEDIGIQVFFKDENKFFDDTLKISNSKHYRNLRFLSSKHKHEVIKLRIIHKPFSNLFLLRLQQFLFCLGDA